MIKMEKILKIVPLENELKDLCNIISEKIKETYLMENKIEYVDINIPDFSYDKNRKQYNAFLMLSSFSNIFSEYTLFITNKDIYVPGMNFIFGLAWKRLAIISIARLLPTFYGEKMDYNIFISRVIKEAIHEIGHLLSLSHCPNSKCVMHFSNSIYDTDYKNEKPCQKCYSILKNKGII
ncbi:MAG: archaemetzincin family Zn-dependent metalloprotease [Nitrososphaerota archaeon]